MAADSDKAIALRIGQRFYIGISPAGRMQTAWSLAGASLFGEWQKIELAKAEREIEKRKKSSVRQVVVVKGPA